MLLSLLTSLALLITSIAAVPSSRNSEPRVRRAPSTSSETSATYDYVIVGGGTAGLVIASRLSENPSLRVAVIEAGGRYEVDNGNVSVIPGYATVGAGTSPADIASAAAVDWGFITTPQAGAANREMHYARGKTLGGSSARNFLVYHRQTTGSAQMWADQVDDQSYTFENMLPYYEKSSQYTPPQFPQPNSTNIQDPNTLTSKPAPVQVSFGGYNDPFGTWIIPAFKAIGQAAINGFTSGKLIGAAYCPSTINPDGNKRSSSETAYLQPAINRTNLHVYQHTLANRILFDSAKRATGVNITAADSTTQIISATKEIILSAGAFQSPQLLMLSGIGPAATLNSLSIPLITDSPGVGQNLWDQVYYGTTFPVNLLTNSAGLNNPALTAASIAAYNADGSGPLSIGNTGVLGWEKLSTTSSSSTSTPPSSLSHRSTNSTTTPSLSPSTKRALSIFPADWPELEFLPASGTLGYQRSFATEDPRDGHNYGTIATALVAPLSRGNITINSTSAADPPVINPNWLTHPADIELAIAAFKRQRQVWSEGLSKITVGEEKIPGGDVQSDAQILKFIRESLAPVWHAACTCKMGRAGDAMAVVDAEARVRGVSGLRVVDASAFPVLPPGHPQATIYALAEKIAEGILVGTGGNRTDGAAAGLTGLGASGQAGRATGPGIQPLGYGP